MMIPISIHVKENAYDKIIYFLSHLKEDVVITTTPQTSNLQKPQQLKILERLSTLDKLVAQSNNRVTVTKNIAIDTDEMSNDIS
jgi:hypothetical protein